ncbi:MAG: DUF6456 domain-containing protein [Rhizomicrobium sp.]
MSPPTEQEILREARRLFRRLADPKAKLMPLGQAGWAILQRGAPDSGRVKTCDEMVSALRRRGWLDECGEALVLSDAGRSWAIAEVAGIDQFAVQHQQLRVCVVRGEDGEESAVVVNDAESPLAWLKARGGIDARQFEAGEKLRRDFTLAQLEPRLCIDLAAPVVLASRNPHAPGISETAVAAKQRFSKALFAVGAGLSDVLFDVCCALKGLEAAESRRKWPRRSGKVVLGLALDRLADHYGIRAAPPHTRVRAWSADNLEMAGV